MKIWYQVVLTEQRKVFGFAAVNGIVSDAPYELQRTWVGLVVGELRQYLIQNKALVYIIKT